MVRDHIWGLVGTTVFEVATPSGRRLIVKAGDWAPEPSLVGRMSRWKQPYLVATVCRILFTWAEGTLPSEPAALAWGGRTSRRASGR